MTPGFGPTQGVAGTTGASAGLYAFLIVVGLIAVSVVIFIAMNRSLKKVRTNLGGSVLPRREADRLPVTPEPAPPGAGPWAPSRPAAQAPATALPAAAEMGRPVIAEPEEGAADAAERQSVVPSAVEPPAGEPSAGESARPADPDGSSPS